MSDKMSNADVMQVFKNIEETKKNSSHQKIIDMQNNLVQNLSFLVYSNTARYKKFSNYEDLNQEGFIGLIKAVRRFDYKKFPNFFVFANQWITNGVKRAAKKYDVVYNPNKNRVIYKELDEEKNENFDLDEIIFNTEVKNKIFISLKSLPERDQKIIRGLFGFENDEETLREIGKKCDLSYERIRQIKNDSIEKLQNNSNIKNIE